MNKLDFHGLLLITYVLYGVIVILTFSNPNELISRLFWGILPLIIMEALVLTWKFPKKG